MIEKEHLCFIYTNILYFVDKNSPTYIYKKSRIRRKWKIYEKRN